MGMWTDALISFLSICAVFLNHQFGKMQHISQMREYIALAKRNATKKFYKDSILKLKDNADKKAKAVEDLNLKSKLVDNILKRKNLYEEKVKQPIEPKDDAKKDKWSLEKKY